MLIEMCCSVCCSVLPCANRKKGPSISMCCSMESEERAVPICSISMYVLSQCDAVKRKSSLFRCVAVWSQEKELSRQVLSQCVFYLNLRAISMCCSQKKELTSCAVCSPKKKLSRHVLSQCVAARRNSFLFRYVAKELEERAVSTCSI